MIVSELSTQVNDLLRPMGITRNLSAYSILCQCLELVCEQEDRLQAVEKDIYTPIADRRRCEPKAIQSAVRRAAKGAWLTNPEYVQQLAGYPLTGAPRRAAVKPFAGAVLLHRDTPAVFLLDPKRRVDPFFHKIHLHTQGYTLTSLPGGGIIVCAEVRQNLLYRAVTPSGKRFGNLLRCW